MDLATGRGGWIEGFLRQEEIAEAFPETLGEVFEAPEQSWPDRAGAGSDEEGGSR